jgi:O-antigen ligase
MHGWLSISSLGGMAIVAAFTLLAIRDLRRAVLWYAVLGAAPFFEVGAFAGNEMVQGMPLAVTLATVIIAVWLSRRDGAPRLRLLPFERCLLLLIPVALLSLTSGLAWLDTAVPAQHVHVTVSVGQILLFAWPIGVYFVTADVVDGPDWTARFTRLVSLLALPQFVMMVAPSTRAYLFWSTYFGLVAAPLLLARATYERAIWKKALLASFIVPPLLLGFSTGKAFLYGYVLVSAGAVLWLRARGAMRVALPAAACAVLLLVALIGPEALPGPLEDLVQEEESQQSWGGKNGRGQLMADTIDLWTRHPLLGVGPGNSYPYMIHYVGLGTPHSQYGGLLLDCGLAGLLVFVAFIGGTLRFAWTALQQPRDEAQHTFVVGWAASFAGMAVLSLTGDYMLHNIRNGGIEMFTGFYIQWVFLGAASGLVRHQATAVVCAPPAPARGPLVWAGPLEPEAEPELELEGGLAR